MYRVIYQRLERLERIVQADTPKEAAGIPDLAWSHRWDSITVIDDDGNETVIDQDTLIEDF